MTENNKNINILIVCIHVKSITYYKFNIKLEIDINMMNVFVLQNKYIFLIANARYNQLYIIA